MNYNAMIQAAIRKSENDAPDIPLVVKVVSPAPEPPDADEMAYSLIRNMLSGQQRAKIEQDYKIWKNVKIMMNTISAKVIEDDSGLDSPVKKRLCKPLVRSPRMWHVCSKCRGTGAGDIGYCRNCEGNGYAI